MPYDLGSTFPVEWARGASNDANTVTLTVTKPDGTTATPSVTHDAGTFTASVEGTLAGRYLLTWLDSTADLTNTDIVEVWPADPRFIVSLGEALDHLKWNAASRAADGPMLRLYIAAATPVIEDIAGAVLLRTIEQYADGGRSGVALWERPDEIASVEVDGTAITDYVPNMNAAIVYRGRHGERFPDGRQIIKVTYTTGGSTIAPNVRLGTLELVRHLWQVGQQVTSGTVIEYGQQGGQIVTTPSGYAVPKRVLELCSSTYRLPGMA